MKIIIRKTKFYSDSVSKDEEIEVRREERRRG